jgi:hypothetical protein
MARAVTHCVPITFRASAASATSGSAAAGAHYIAIAITIVIATNVNRIRRTQGGNSRTVCSAPHHVIHCTTSDKTHGFADATRARTRPS